MSDKRMSCPSRMVICEMYVQFLLKALSASCRASNAIESPMAILLKIPRWYLHVACLSSRTCPETDDQPLDFGLFTEARSSFPEAPVPSSRRCCRVTHLCPVCHDHEHARYGDHVGEGQPCRAWCPAEVFVPLHVHVCPPVSADF